MRVVAAYMLAVLGGKANPDANAIKAILDSVGIKGEDDQINKVVGALNGKNIDELIAQGLTKLAAVPTGGAGASAGAAAPAAGAAASGASAPAAEKEKEKEKEASEEGDLGFSLFD